MKGNDWNLGNNGSICTKTGLNDEDRTTDDTINRQAAIEDLHKSLMYRMGTDSNKKRLDDWINSLPSAQPEIIRCKDCKNWKRQVVGINDGLGSCSFHEASFVSCNGYCYWAERREDGETDL